MKKLTKKQNRERLKRYKENAKIGIPKWQQKEIIDIMTRSKKPKLIAPIKSINDSSFLIETFPRMLMQDYQEIIKDLIPIMKKYKIMKLEASMFKKWMDGQETDMGAVNKI